MNSILMCSFLAAAVSAGPQEITLQPTPLAMETDSNAPTPVNQSMDHALEFGGQGQIGCCQDAGACCRSGCRHRHCGCLCQRHQLKKSLPTPWHAPGNMYQHLPYETYPKTYYYFRPYNYLHIAEHQEESEEIGLDPRLPYSNAPFEAVYREFATERPEARQPVAPLLAP